MTSADVVHTNHHASHIAYGTSQHRHHRATIEAGGVRCACGKALRHTMAMSGLATSSAVHYAAAPGSARPTSWSRFVSRRV